MTTWTWKRTWPKSVLSSLSRFKASSSRTTTFYGPLDKMDPYSSTYLQGEVQTKIITPSSLQESTSGFSVTGGSQQRSSIPTMMSLSRRSKERSIPSTWRTYSRKKRRRERCHSRVSSYHTQWSARSRSQIQPSYLSCSSSTCGPSITWSMRSSLLSSVSSMAASPSQITFSPTSWES